MVQDLLLLQLMKKESIGICSVNIDQCMDIMKNNDKFQSFAALPFAFRRDYYLEQLSFFKIKDSFKKVEGGRK